MALPDSILTVVGDAQIVFRDSTDFSPTAANDLRQGSPTLVQLDMTSVANTAARQSAKVDLGANRPPLYFVMAALEFAATPTAGAICEAWWAYSPSATAGTANPGGVSGSDADYTGYSSNLDASLVQLQYIGHFVTTAQATGTVQVGNFGFFRPWFRYGSLVVKNVSGAAFHSDAVETHVVLQPYFPQVQD